MPKSKRSDKFEIGKRVRRIREMNNFTREQFAEEIDISPQFMAEIENGTKGMSFETLTRMCRYYASADYILFGRQNTEIKTPAAQVLAKIPEEYSEEVATVLDALLAMSERNKK